MDFRFEPFKGISKSMVFGLDRKSVYQYVLDLGLKPYEQGGDREWIEELDLVIHYSDQEKINGYEFFCNNQVDLKLYLNSIDMMTLSYDELYNLLTGFDDFVIRFNDSFISFSLGIVVGFNPEKTRSIESIYFMEEKEGYKKIIISQIEEFY